MRQTDILIVGGGIAGLGLAAGLAGRRPGQVLLVDREGQPGFYASGHNAAIARQLTGRPEHTALTVEGTARLGEAGLILHRGGLLLEADPGGLDALRQEALAFGVPADAGTGCPLAGLQAVGHLRLPVDGVMDADRLLAHCADRARTAGAELAYGIAVQAVHPGSEGFEVETSAGAIRSRVLVNAAGAWAGPLGAMAGGHPLVIQPLRRHLRLVGDFTPEGHQGLAPELLELVSDEDLHGLRV